MTKDEFIAYLAPYAIQLRLEGSPMFPSVRLAQNLLETGGKLHPWHNLGGIKVGRGKPNEWWDGSSVQKNTWEVIDGQRIDTSANFRAYASIYHFYKDQDLLFGNARYARVRNASTPAAQAEALYLCGYATDPAYASKLKAIMTSYALFKYDEEAAKLKGKLEELMTKYEELARKSEELSEQNKRLGERLAKKSEELSEQNKCLEERLARLELKKEQKVASWAKDGYEFVIEHGISDGTRPEDPATRQEVWTMLERMSKHMNS